MLQSPPPPAKAGWGIVRLSGPGAYHIGTRLTQCELKPRYAHFTPFYENAIASADQQLDEGLALYFKALHIPSPVKMWSSCKATVAPSFLMPLSMSCIHQGARLANPGEFSERAFLNDKLDLAQAEAIADLIDSSSLQAARNALRSLQGDFSREIHTLVENVTHLRVFVEAAIDFPEEEIDFITDGRVAEQLQGNPKPITGDPQQCSARPHSARRHDRGDSGQAKRR